MDDRVREFERKYNKHLVSMFFYAVVILFVSVIITIVFRNLLVGFLSVWVGIFIVMSMTKSKKENLKIEFENLVVNEGLKKKFISFKYNLKHGFDESFIYNLNLFDDWKFFSSNNCISSIYNKVRFLCLMFQ